MKSAIGTADIRRLRLPRYYCLLYQFPDVVVNHVYSPIIIDQESYCSYYCTPCKRKVQAISLFLQCIEYSKMIDSLICTIMQHSMGVLELKGITFSSIQGSLGMHQMLQWNIWSAVKTILVRMWKWSVTSTSNAAGMVVEIPRLPAPLINIPDRSPLLLKLLSILLAMIYIYI